MLIGWFKGWVCSPPYVVLWVQLRQELPVCSILPSGGIAQVKLRFVSMNYLLQLQLLHLLCQVHDLGSALLLPLALALPIPLLRGAVLALARGQLRVRATARVGLWRAPRRWDGHWRCLQHSIHFAFCRSMHSSVDGTGCWRGCKRTNSASVYNGSCAIHTAIQIATIPV